MYPSKKPTQLKDAISQLIATRGLARSGADAELKEAWKEIAGERISENTRVVAMKRGVLELAVYNSAMLSELVSFQKQNLLKAYKKRFSKHGVRDFRFKLESRKQSNG